MFLKRLDVQVLIVSDISMPQAFRRGTGNGRPDMKFEKMKRSTFHHISCQDRSFLLYMSSCTSLCFHQPHCLKYNMRLQDMCVIELRLCYRICHLYEIKKKHITNGLPYL